MPNSWKWAPRPVQIQRGVLESSDSFHRWKSSTNFCSWLAVSRFDLPASNMHICTYMHSLSNRWYFSAAVSGALFSLFHMRGGCVTYCSLIPFAVFIMPAPKRQSRYLVAALVQPVFCLPGRQGTRIHLQMCTDVGVLSEETYWVFSHGGCLYLLAEDKSAEVKGYKKVLWY